MIEREELLQAICDSPNDDSRRIALAEWLEAYGEAVAAGRIRWWVENRPALLEAVRTDGDSDAESARVLLERLENEQGGEWRARLAVCLAVRLLVKRHPVRWTDICYATDYSEDYETVTSVEHWESETPEAALWSGLAAAEMFATGAIWEIGQLAGILEHWQASAYSGCESSPTETSASAAAYAAVVLATIESLVGGDTGFEGEYLESFVSGLDQRCDIPQSSEFWPLIISALGLLLTWPVPSHLNVDTV